MIDLTIRVYPGMQKIIAMTIYLGREIYGQGDTAGDALIDLGTQLKGIPDEVRTRWQYTPPAKDSIPVSPH